MAEQVRTAHLLIKHTGSRNPVSRRTGAEVTLSPEDALAELQSYEARIKAEGVNDAFPKYGALTFLEVILLLESTPFIALTSKIIYSRILLKLC